MILLTRIDRYIAVHVLSAFFVVLLVLVGLMALSMLLEELGDVNQYYQLSDALLFILLSFPSFIDQLLPMSALVGTLIGLGILATNSELTVMRASGLSLGSLICSISKPVLVIAALGLFLSEVGVPVAQQKAQYMKAIAQSAGGKIVTEGGAWYREGDAFIHVTAIGASGELYGVIEHLFDEDNRLKQSRTAERVILNAETDTWELIGVKTLQLNPLSGNLDLSVEARVPWLTTLNTELLGVLLVKPRDLPISGLHTYSKYLAEQGVNAARYELAFWNKLLQPFAVLALVLIGTAFIFGPLRSVTVGQRILTGVVIGLGFKFSQDLLSPASQLLGFSPALAAAAPLAIGLVAAALLLVRVR